MYHKGRSIPLLLLLCAGMLLVGIYQAFAQYYRFAAAEGSLERFDCYAPLLSLPAIFGTTLESIPHTVPYLFADPARVARLGITPADAGRQAQAALFGSAARWLGQAVVNVFTKPYAARPRGVRHA